MRFSSRFFSTYRLKILYEFRSPQNVLLDLQMSHCYGDTTVARRINTGILSIASVRNLQATSAMLIGRKCISIDEMSTSKQPEPWMVYLLSRLNVLRSSRE